MAAKDTARALDPKISRVLATLSRLIIPALLLFVAFFWTMQLSDQHSHSARKKVRFWHMWTAEWKDVVDKIVDKFNKSQDQYEVEALSVPSQGADSKFILGVMGGDPPDVMAQWNPVIPPWAEDHLLTPYEELMTPEEKRIFDEQAYPVVKKVGTYKGKLYGMAIGINMMALYYLPKQLKETGIDPDHMPTTLEGLTQIGAKLDRFDKQGNLTRLGWSPNNFQHVLPLFGGQLYDWNTGKMTIDTPENLAALTYLSNWNKRLGIDNVVRFNSGLNLNSATGEWPFIEGAFSITVDGQWRVEQLRRYAPEVEYRTMAIPPAKGGKPLSGMANGNFMIVPRGAKQPKGAWEFIKFWSGLTDPTTAAEFYTMGGWLPLTPAIAKAPAYQAYLRKYPQFKAFVDLMPSDNMDTLPPIPYQEFLSDQIGRMEERVSHGSQSPEQGLSSLKALIDTEVQRRKELGYDR